MVKHSAKYYGNQRKTKKQQTHARFELPTRSTQKRGIDHEEDQCAPKMQRTQGHLLKLFSRSNILVIGASQCGKTTAVLNIIKNELVETKPVKIFYLYAAHQPFMDTWNKDKSNPPIEFVEGLKLDVVDKVKGHKILVIVVSPFFLGRE